MKRNSLGVKLSSQQSKKPAQDLKVFESSDSKIIYPLNFKGKSYQNWTGFWNQLNTDIDDYIYWYKLQKIDSSIQSSKTIKYLIKCRVCKSQIKVEYQLQKTSESRLKVLSVQNAHNHTNSCLENTDKHQRISKTETLNQIGDIFLFNKSYSVFKVYQPVELTSFRARQIFEVDTFVSSQNNKKDFIYTVSFDMFAEEEKIVQRAFKFSPKTKKQLDLIAIAFALCQGLYLNIPKMNIICNYQNSKLCNNTWQSQMLLSKLDESSTRIYKIIKTLISKFEKINFFSQEQQKLKTKTLDTNLKNTEKEQQQQEQIKSKKNDENQNQIQDQETDKFLNCNIVPQKDNKIQDQQDPFDFLRQFDSSLSN